MLFIAEIMRNEGQARAEGRMDAEELLVKLYVVYVVVIAANSEQQKPLSDCIKLQCLDEKKIIQLNISFHNTRLILTRRSEL